MTASRRLLGTAAAGTAANQIARRCGGTRDAFSIGLLHDWLVVYIGAAIDQLCLPLTSEVDDGTNVSRRAMAQIMPAGASCYLS